MHAVEILSSASDIVKCLRYFQVLEILWCCLSACCGDIVKCQQVETALKGFSSPWIKFSANFPSNAKTSNLDATERGFLVSLLKGLCFQSRSDCSDFLHQRIFYKYRLPLWRRWLSLHDPRDGKRPSFRLLCTPIISL